MSLENVESFIEFLKTNEALATQIKEVDSTEKFTELSVKLGGENGFTFTPQEVGTFLAQKKMETEFSDQDLEAIAGGKGGCPLGTRFTICVLRTGCFDSKC